MKDVKIFLPKENVRTAPELEISNNLKYHSRVFLHNIINIGQISAMLRF